MDWAGFRFQDPAWLWAALAGPLVLLAARLREGEGRAVSFPGASRLRRLGVGWRVRVRHLPIALAQPGGEQHQRTRQRGPQPSWILEAEAGPVHQAAFPSGAEAAAGGRRRDSRAGISVRTAAR